MIPNIDRAVHSHGLHNLGERHIDAHLRALSDATPHNHTDLAQVLLAEQLPQRLDGSLNQNEVCRGAVYQRNEGGRGLYGDVYDWDGADLARRAADPNGFTKP